MPATRKQRLQDQLREVLSEVIRREMRDPRFTDGLLTITDVEVTNRLQKRDGVYQRFGERGSQAK